MVSEGTALFSGLSRHYTALMPRRRFSLFAAENSLPANLTDMTPNERRAALTESLARSERLLLAAAGELYRSWRIATSTNTAVIENPPQSSFRDLPQPD